MSPEQASGREVDQRSDIFSLGVLLFESIAGEFPFRGTETPEVLHEIAYAPTPSLGAFRGSVPEALQIVIEKMLKKDPALRYKSARQLLTDLRAVRWCIDSNAPFSSSETVTIANAGTMANAPRPRGRRLVIPAMAALTLALLATGAAVTPVRHRAAEWLFRRPIPAQKRIAVLPFTNIGGDPSMQVFCDGLMEDVTGALTGLERFHVTLNVVPPSEVRKENITSAKDAGRILGANLVVTGSVRRTGKDVDMWIGLSDTRTVTQLRSETFHARWPELAGMQFEVQDKVARMLELVLQPAASQSLSAGNTTVAAAYRSYGGRAGVSAALRSAGQDRQGDRVVSVSRRGRPAVCARLRGPGSGAAVPLRSAQGNSLARRRARRRFARARSERPAGAGSHRDGHDSDGQGRE
jgi:serine/threonine-protein kinase